MINKVEGIKIKGIAAAVPTRHTVPDDYIDSLGVDAVESFKKASGVMKRHMVTEKLECGDMSIWQTGGDLVCEAANKLIEKFSIDRNEVGAIVLVSQTRDYAAPCTSCVLQKRLNLSDQCLAFDVTLGCSGYGYGVGIAASLMSTSDMKYALVLVADTQAGYSDKTKATSSNTMLMGDSGTATLLERDKSAEPIVFMTRTDGWGFDKTGILSGGSRHPGAPRGKYFMDDVDVFNYITTTGPEIINSYMEYMGTSPEDYDCFALHQASLFSLKTLARRIKVKMNKIPLSLTQFGNTGPASIPVTACFAYGEDEEKKTVNILMSGFGVGLSAAAFSAKIDVEGILPIFETDEWFDDGFHE